LLQRLTAAAESDRWTVTQALAFLNAPDVERLEAIRSTTRAEAAAAAAAAAARAARVGAGVVATAGLWGTTGGAAAGAAVTAAGAPMHECRDA